MTPKQKALAAILARRTAQRPFQTWEPTPGMMTLIGMEFEGPDGSTIFNEQTGKVVTASGDSKLSAAQKYSGLTSVIFDGSGDRLSVANAAEFLLASKDWRLRVAYRPTVNSSTQEVIAHRLSAVNSFWYLRRNAGGVMRFQAVNAGTVVTDIVTTGTAGLNAWNVSDIRRTSGVVSHNLNGGTGITGTNNVGNYAAPTAPVLIGDGTETGGSPYTGFIDALLWEVAP